MRHQTANMITILLLAAPLAVSAQTDATASDTNGIDVERAVMLEVESQRWVTNFVDVKKAARLMREAASLRPTADPAGVHDLITAGHLYYYARDFRRAREAMVDAAERASGMGDLVRAADSWINAAHLSARLKDVPAARTYHERARTLAASPLLSATQVSRIHARLDPTSAAVVAARESSR